MRSAFSLAVVTWLSLATLLALTRGEEPSDDWMEKDLALLQGEWELFHGNAGEREPTLHSIKVIKGNQETLRRYDIKSGKLIREHSVDFTLARSGEVRVFTFYAVGGDAKRGQSFVYKVDAENFYDVSGVLQGETFRNYQETPTVWHWKRRKGDTPPPQPQPESLPPPPEIDPALLKKLEFLGAKVSTTTDGHVIDIRRRILFSDKDIDLIVQCPQVAELTLEGVQITNQGLEKLRPLKHVKRLILNDCAISAEGMEILADLPLSKTVISIGLRGTKIKEDDLKWLKGFSQLQRLDVSGTSLSDASLPALEMLPLLVLNVKDVPFSAAALAQLQTKLPKLVVKK